MDPFDGRMRQMAALDAIGGALAGDRAVTGSSVNDHVFTLYVPEGRVHAYESVDGQDTPYRLTSSAKTVHRELLAMREAETEKWDGIILRLDKSSSHIGMDFLYGEGAHRLAPADAPARDQGGTLAPAGGREAGRGDTHGTPVWALALIAIIALVVIGVVIYVVAT